MILQNMYWKEQCRSLAEKTWVDNKVESRKKRITNIGRKRKKGIDNQGWKDKEKTRGILYKLIFYRSESIDVNVKFIAIVIKVGG